MRSGRGENPEPFSEFAAHNPVHVWLEVTNRCNARCIYCGHHYSDFGEDMDTDLYKKIKSDALDHLQGVELYGYGEPFLASHFDDFFEDCI